MQKRINRCTTVATFDYPLVDLSLAFLPSVSQECRLSLNEFDPRDMFIVFRSIRS